MARESRELVVVGVDGILWPGSLTHETLLGMERRKWISKTDTEVDSTAKRMQVIAQAITKKSQVTVRDIAFDVAGRFMRGLDGTMTERLKEFPDDRYCLVALATAPSFVVGQVVRRMREERGISFERHLSSTFQLDKEHVYTGGYTRLNKQAAIRGLLRETGLPRVAVGFVNGRSDLPWSSEYCSRVELVNPGPVVAAILAQQKP